MKSAQRGSQGSRKGMVELSIVVPAFEEEGNLEKLYLELVKVLTSLDMSWEIVFADDNIGFVLYIIRKNPKLSTDINDQENGHIK